MSGPSSTTSVDRASGAQSPSAPDRTAAARRIPFDRTSLTPQEAQRVEAILAQMTELENTMDYERLIALLNDPSNKNLLQKAGLNTGEAVSAYEKKRILMAVLTRFDVLLREKKYDDAVKLIDAKSSIIAKETADTLKKMIEYRKLSDPVIKKADELVAGKKYNDAIALLKAKATLLKSAGYNVDALIKETEGQKLTGPVVDRAQDLIGQGRFVDAYKLIDMKASLFGGEGEMLLQRIDLGIKRAIALVDQGRYSEAIASLAAVQKNAEEALKSAPQEGRNKINEYIGKIRESVQALEEYSNALAVNDIGKAIDLLKTKGSQLKEIGVKTEDRLKELESVKMIVVVKFDGSDPEVIKGAGETELVKQMQTYLRGSKEPLEGLPYLASSSTLKPGTMDQQTAAALANFYASTRSLAPQALSEKKHAEETVADPAAKGVPKKQGGDKSEKAKSTGNNAPVTIMVTPKLLEQMKESSEQHCHYIPLSAMIRTSALGKKILDRLSGEKVGDGALLGMIRSFLREKRGLKTESLNDVYEMCGGQFSEDDVNAAAAKYDEYRGAEVQGGALPVVKVNTITKQIQEITKDTALPGQVPAYVKSYTRGSEAASFEPLAFWKLQYTKSGGALATDAAAPYLNAEDIRIMSVDLSRASAGMVGAFAMENESSRKTAEEMISGSSQDPHLVSAMRKFTGMLELQARDAKFLKELLEKSPKDLLENLKPEGKQTLISINEKLSSGKDAVLTYEETQFLGAILSETRDKLSAEEKTRTTGIFSTLSKMENGEKDAFFRKISGLQKEAIDELRKDPGLSKKLDEMLSRYKDGALPAEILWVFINRNGGIERFASEKVRQYFMLYGFAVRMQHSNPISISEAERKALVALSEKCRAENRVLFYSDLAAMKKDPDEQIRLAASVLLERTLSGRVGMMEAQQRWYELYPLPDVFGVPKPSGCDLTKVKVMYAQERGIIKRRDDLKALTENTAAEIEKSERSLEELKEQQAKGFTNERAEEINKKAALIAQQKISLAGIVNELNGIMAFLAGDGITRDFYLWFVDKFVPKKAGMARDAMAALAKDSLGLAYTEERDGRSVKIDADEVCATLRRGDDELLASLPSWGARGFISLDAGSEGGQELTAEQKQAIQRVKNAFSYFLSTSSQYGAIKKDKTVSLVETAFIENLRSMLCPPISETAKYGEPAVRFKMMVLGMYQYFLKEELGFTKAEIEAYRRNIECGQTDMRTITKTDIKICKKLLETISDKTVTDKINKLLTELENKCGWNGSGELIINSGTSGIIYEINALMNAENELYRAGDYSSAEVSVGSAQGFSDYFLPFLNGSYRQTVARNFDKRYEGDWSVWGEAKEFGAGLATKYFGQRIMLETMMPLYIRWGLPISGLFNTYKLAKGDIGWYQWALDGQSGIARIPLAFFMFRNFPPLWYRQVYKDIEEGNLPSAVAGLLVTNFIAMRGGWDSVWGNMLTMDRYLYNRFLWPVTGKMIAGNPEIAKGYLRYRSENGGIFRGAVTKPVAEFTGKWGYRTLNFIGYLTDSSYTKYHLSYSKGEKSLVRTVSEKPLVWLDMVFLKTSEATDILQNRFILRPFGWGSRPIPGSKRTAFDNSPSALFPAHQQQETSASAAGSQRGDLSAAAITALQGANPVQDDIITRVAGTVLEGLKSEDAKFIAPAAAQKITGFVVINDVDFPRSAGDAAYIMGADGNYTVYVKRSAIEIGNDGFLTGTGCERLAAAMVHELAEIHLKEMGRPAPHEDAKTVESMLIQKSAEARAKQIRIRSNQIISENKNDPEAFLKGVKDQIARSASESETRALLRAALYFETKTEGFGKSLYDEQLVALDRYHSEINIFLQIGTGQGKSFSTLLGAGEEVLSAKANPGGGYSRANIILCSEEGLAKQLYEDSAVRVLDRAGVPLYFVDSQKNRAFTVTTEFKNGKYEVRLTGEMTIQAAYEKAGRDGAVMLMTYQERAKHLSSGEIPRESIPRGCVWLEEVDWATIENAATRYIISTPGGMEGNQIVRLWGSGTNYVMWLRARVGFNAALKKAGGDAAVARAAFLDGATGDSPRARMFDALLLARGQIMDSYAIQTPKGRAEILASVTKAVDANSQIDGKTFATADQAMAHLERKYADVRRQYHMDPDTLVILSDSNHPEPDKRFGGFIDPALRILSGGIPDGQMSTFADTDIFAMLEHADKVKGSSGTAFLFGEMLRDIYGRGLVVEEIKPFVPEIRITDAVLRDQTQRQEAIDKIVAAAVSEEKYEGITERVKIVDQTSSGNTGERDNFLTDVNSALLAKQGDQDLSDPVRQNIPNAVKLITEPPMRIYLRDPGNPGAAQKAEMTDVAKKAIETAKAGGVHLITANSGQEVEQVGRIIAEQNGLSKIKSGQVITIGGRKVQVLLLSEIHSRGQDINELLRTVKENQGKEKGKEIGTIVVNDQLFRGFDIYAQRALEAAVKVAGAELLIKAGGVQVDYIGGPRSEANLVQSLGRAARAMFAGGKSFSLNMENTDNPFFRHLEVAVKAVAEEQGETKQFNSVQDLENYLRMLAADKAYIDTVPDSNDPKMQALMAVLKKCHELAKDEIRQSIAATKETGKIMAECGTRLERLAHATYRPPEVMIRTVFAETAERYILESGNGGKTPLTQEQTTKLQQKLAGLLKVDETRVDLSELNGKDARAAAKIIEEMLFERFLHGKGGRKLFSLPEFAFRISERILTSFSEYKLAEEVVKEKAAGGEDLRQKLQAAASKSHGDLLTSLFDNSLGRFNKALGIKAGFFSGTLRAAPEHARAAALREIETAVRERSIFELNPKAMNAGEAAGVLSRYGITDAASVDSVVKAAQKRGAVEASVTGSSVIQEQGKASSGSSPESERAAAPTADQTTVPVRQEKINEALAEAQEASTKKGYLSDDALDAIAKGHHLTEQEKQELRKRVPENSRTSVGGGQSGAVSDEQAQALRNAESSQVRSQPQELAGTILRQWLVSAETNHFINPDAAQKITGFVVLPDAKFMRTGIPGDAAYVKNADGTYTVYMRESAASDRTRFSRAAGHEIAEIHIAETHTHLDIEQRQALAHETARVVEQSIGTSTVVADDPAMKAPMSQRVHATMEGITSKTSGSIDAGGSMGFLMSLIAYNLVPELWNNGLTNVGTYKWWESSTSGSYDAAIRGAFFAARDNVVQDYVSGSIFRANYGDPSRWGKDVSSASKWGFTGFNIFAMGITGLFDDALPFAQQNKELLESANPYMREYYYKALKWRMIQGSVSNMAFEAPQLAMILIPGANRLPGWSQFGVRTAAGIGVNFLSRWAFEPKLRDVEKEYKEKAEKYEKGEIGYEDSLDASDRAAQWAFSNPDYINAAAETAGYLSKPIEARFNAFAAEQTLGRIGVNRLLSSEIITRGAGRLTGTMTGVSEKLTEKMVTETATKMATKQLGSKGVEAFGKEGVARIATNLKGAAAQRVSAKFAFAQLSAAYAAGEWGYYMGYSAEGVKDGSLKLGLAVGGGYAIGVGTGVLTFGFSKAALATGPIGLVAAGLMFNGAVAKKIIDTQMEMHKTVEDSQKREEESMRSESLKLVMSGWVSMSGTKGYSREEIDKMFSQLPKEEREKIYNASRLGFSSPLRRSNWIYEGGTFGRYTGTTTMENDFERIEKSFDAFMSKARSEKEIITWLDQRLPNWRYLLSEKSGQRGRFEDKLGKIFSSATVQAYIKELDSGSVVARNIVEEYLKQPSLMNIPPTYFWEKSGIRPDIDKAEMARTMAEKRDEFIKAQQEMISVVEKYASDGEKAELNKMYEECASLQEKAATGSKEASEQLLKLVKQANERLDALYKKYNKTATVVTTIR